MARRLGLRLVLLVWPSLSPIAVTSRSEADAAAVCVDEESCHAQLQNVTQILHTSRLEIRGKRLTLEALETLRNGIINERRVEIPSTQRRHLEPGSPLIDEISFDVRHRPISTDASRHLAKIRSIAEDLDVRLFSFMPLRRPASARNSGAPKVLLAVVDADATLSFLTLQGDVLMDRFDLGHSAGSTVVQLALSPSKDRHAVFTVDEAGEVRVHELKVLGRAKQSSSNDLAIKKPENVTARLEGAFSLGPKRKLNQVLPVDLGGKGFLVTADAQGGIGLFTRNGTLKGRMRVTRDRGGVRGLIRGKGRTILFYSARSFGFFSALQMDVLYPPCREWSSPVSSVALDPYAASRVIVALEDGEVLVFANPMEGDTRTCRLEFKLPHISSRPFQLSAEATRQDSVAGHVAALRTGNDTTPELYFFNLAAMEAGYGLEPSRCVAAQILFKARRLEGVGYWPDAPPTSAFSTTPGRERFRSSTVAFRFAGRPGVELYELNLRPAPRGSGSEEGGAGDPDDEDGWLSSWLSRVLLLLLIAGSGGVLFYRRRARTRREEEEAKAKAEKEKEETKDQTEEEKDSKDDGKAPAGAGGATTAAPAEGSHRRQTSRSHDNAYDADEVKIEEVDGAGEG